MNSNPPRTVRETSIARLFHWEMGHRLPFHTGGCANIHGHSYRMWLELTGICDMHGMLVDFGDMKLLVQPLLDRMDHSFLCDKDDSLLMDFLQTNGFKLCDVPMVTTAENIAAWLLESIVAIFIKNERISSINLRLHETENSYAEVQWHRNVVESG